jgi:hypothetical protein
MSDKTINRVIRLCLISGDAFQDAFMHATDVFEPSKRLATPRFFRMELLPHADLPKIVEQFRLSAEKELKVSVVACFAVGTDIGYIDDTVKTVSDGEKWCLLDEMLLAAGWCGKRVESERP